MNIKAHPQISSRDYKCQQLIDATIKTISQFGLSKTTISKVTKQANMSAGIVNFYFSSKEQLLLGTLKAINDEFKEEIESAFSTHSTAMEVLERVIRTYFSDTLCDIDKIAVWSAFSSESAARQDYMDICGDHDSWFHAKLLIEFEHLCAQHNRPLNTAVPLSRGLEGIIDGYWQEYLYKPESFHRDDAINICLDYLHAVFDISNNNEGSSKLEKPDDNAVKKLESEHCDYMPTWAYYDEELLDLEKQHIFKKNWLLVGHINDVPNPRDYLTFDAVGERALIVRDNAGKIHAFHNVCRHRGAKLVDKPNGQCAHALTCPFHGWTYQLDGKLIGVPAENTFENLDKSLNGLVPLDLEIWMGFVFVRFSPGNISLAETMRPIEKIIAPYNIHSMQPISGTRYDEILPYNWKVIHDIDNEGYHVPIGHPSLQQLYGKDYSDRIINDIPVSYAYLNEKPGKLWSVKNYQNLLPEFDHLPKENQKLWLYPTIFPSMVLGLYPDSIEFYMTIPISTDKTLLRGGSYALTDNRKGMNAVRYLSRRINRITGREDESYVKWLQDGMQSSAFPEPNLSSIESGVQEFHQKLQKILPVMKLKQHPGQGKVSAINKRMV